MSSFYTRCSTQQARWFKQVFDKIRHTFSNYRIAIFYVFADEVTVRQRVASRMKKTGLLERCVAPKPRTSGSF